MNWNPIDLVTAIVSAIAAGMSFFYAYQARRYKDDIASRSEMAKGIELLPNLEKALKIIRNPNRNEPKDIDEISNKCSIFLSSYPADSLFYQATLEAQSLCTQYRTNIEKVRLDILLKIQYVCSGIKNRSVK